MKTAQAGVVAGAVSLVALACSTSPLGPSSSSSGSSASSSSGSASSSSSGGPEAGTDATTDGGCLPAFDISGTYIERYSCDEGGTCVDKDRTAQITLSGDAATGAYTFSSGSGTWKGSGQLCGKIFTWTATEATYTERGTWTFSDAQNFVKASSYTYTDGGTSGTCSATASRAGQPPAPPPVGACP